MLTQTEMILFSSLTLLLATIVSAQHIHRHKHVPEHIISHGVSSKPRSKFKNLSSSAASYTPNNNKPGIAGGDAYPIFKDHIGWWYDWYVRLISSAGRISMSALQVPDTIQTFFLWSYSPRRPNALGRRYSRRPGRTASQRFHQTLYICLLILYSAWYYASIRTRLRRAWLCQWLWISWHEHRWCSWEMGDSNGSDEEEGCETRES